MLKLAAIFLLTAATGSALDIPKNITPPPVEPAATDKTPFVMPDIFPIRRRIVTPSPLLRQPVPGKKWVESFSRQTLADRLELEPLLDLYFRTDMTFQTDTGETVQVSATEVLNCPDGSPADKCGTQDKYFMVFRTPDGKLQGANAFEIANYGFIKSGKKDFYFGKSKKKYTARMNLSMLNPKESMVELTVEGQKEPVFNVQVIQIVHAVALKARVVQMKRNYNVFYCSNIGQNKKRDVIPLPGTSFLFIPNDSPLDYVTVNSSLISPEGSLLAIEPEYVFKLLPDALEIYKQ